MGLPCGAVWILCNSTSRSQGETNALKSGKLTEALERRFKINIIDNF
jgi:hypothetical protein